MLDSIEDAVKGKEPNISVTSGKLYGTHVCPSIRPMIVCLA